MDCVLLLKHGDARYYGPACCKGASLVKYYSVNLQPRAKATTKERHGIAKVNQSAHAQCQPLDFVKQCELRIVEQHAAVETAANQAHRSAHAHGM
jgi:hypothetical protein